MSQSRPAERLRKEPLPRARKTLSPDGLRRAEVLDIAADDVVLLRLHRATPEEVRSAEIAVIGYFPEVGDRVLVSESDDGSFVVGVLGEARRRTAAQLAPGLVVTSKGDAGVELSVARGDLKLSAKGRIVVLSDSEVTLTAEAVRTTASLVVETAGRHELTAERIVERADSVYRHASGLLQSTAGRARTLVEGDHDMCAGRTSIASDEDTSIDGKRVLLG